MTAIRVGAGVVRPAARNEVRTGVRVGVPWATILTLAVALAFADGFWMISLRGAVGAIERTQSPFANWWREALIATPVFALAVLGALALARRWFGPVLHNAGQVIATAAMITAGGTLAGIAQVAANSAYDYHLQSQQMQFMTSMGSVANQQHATLALHIHAVFYISRWILLTNVVLVAWLLAMYGGRIKLAAARTRPGVAASRADDVRLLVVAALLAGAAIHVAVIGEHFAEWTAAGLFFILLTTSEVAVAGLLLTKVRRRAVLLGAAIVSLGPLVLWLYSRTAGMPLGPEPGTPEAIGLADVVACAAEAVSLLAVVALLRPTSWLRRPTSSAHVKALVVVSLIAVTAIGLAATAPDWFNAFAIAPGHSEMGMSR